MPEMRRPSNSPQRGPRRPVRRSSPPQKSPPPWVKIAIIALPLALIGAVVLWPKKAEPVVESQKPVENPEDKIKVLRSQIAGIRKDYAAWRELMMKEDPSAKSKQEALIRKVDAWGDQWDLILKPLRDKDDKLPAQYQGYSQEKAVVSQIREDILKSSGL